MTSRTCKCALVAIVPLLASVSAPVFAQDVDAMAKWTALTVLHYRVVGEFSGEERILSPPNKYPVSVSAPVTDRVELEFDWDQQEMKLVGKPVIRNFPTKAGAIAPRQGCPVAKVEGTFEFATAVALKDVPGGVALDIRRDHAGGAVPLPGPESGGALCGHAWDTVASKSDTYTDSGFGVPPAMALAMPGVIPISPDGKSLILKANGWTWTFTPTPVK